MSKMFQRVRGAFHRKPRAQEQEQEQLDDSLPNSTRASTLGTITRSEGQTDVEDDIDSVRSYDPPRRILLREQPRNPIPSADNDRNANVYQNGSSVPSNPQPRGTSNNLRSGLPSNNNINTNTTPLSNPNIRAGLPPPSQNQDPSTRPPLNPVSPPVNNLEPSGINLQQTSPQPTTPLPQSSLGSSFPPDVNQNRPPLPINPHSNLVGFPSGIYSNINQRSQALQSRFLAQQEYFRQRNRLPLSNRISSFRPRAIRSQIELDYPIEDVIVDENIPTALALKVNEAIDHDRLGNAYYSQRYAYEPISQRISMGNNQQIQRRLIRNSPQRGIRHIREITNDNYYPQKVQTEDCQLIFEVTPSFDCQIVSTQYNLDSFPTPIHHYVAYALPNDPMRSY